MKGEVVMDSNILHTLRVAEDIIYTKGKSFYPKGNK